MKLVLSAMRGFCSGVKQSLALVEEVLSTHSTPIYAFHPIVHNQYVIEQLKKRGIVFVDAIGDIPERSVVIFSAHGVSKAIYAEAIKRKLKIFDATCMRVKKIHDVVHKASQEGYECIVIGYRTHAETQGIIGQHINKHAVSVVENLDDISILNLKNPSQCVYVTQTTFPPALAKKIIQALHQKFPQLTPQFTRYCTIVERRQAIIRKLATIVDVMIILGSKTSSNAQALKELSLQTGTKTYLVDTPNGLKSEWFVNGSTVGIATSASAPEILVEKTIAWFNAHFEGIHIVK